MKLLTWSFAIGIILAGVALPCLPCVAVSECVDYRDYECATRVLSQAYWVETEAVLDIDISGNYAYLAAADGEFLVVDATDPVHVQVASRISTPGSAVALALSQTYAYVATLPTGLQVVDISDPAHPRIVDSVATPNSVSDVMVFGSHAYLAEESSGLRILDLSDPAHPVEIPQGIAGRVSHLGLSDGVLILTNPSYGLSFFDLSTPDSPSPLSTLALPHASHVAVLGLHAFVSCGTTVTSVDIADPANPQVIGSVTVPSVAGRIVTLEPHAFVTTSQTSVQVLDVSDPTALRIELSLGPSEGNKAIAIDGDRVCIGGIFGSFTVIEIASLETPAVASVQLPEWARVVATRANYAYVGCDFRGIQVVDLTDPRNAQITDQFSTGPGHVAMAASGSFIYDLSTDFGLTILDVGDPAHPVQASGWGDLRDLQDLDASGGFACYTYTHGLAALDVSDPYHPRGLGEVEISTGARKVAVTGTHAFVTDGSRRITTVDLQGQAGPAIAGTFDIEAGGVTGIAASGSYLYTVGGLDFWAVDVVDPANPLPIGHLVLPSNGGDLVVDSGYAHILGAKGLFVVDVRDPGHPQLAGNVCSPGSPQNLAVMATHTVVASLDSGLQVLHRHCGNPSAPAPFTLTYPADLESLTVRDPTLSWRAAQPTFPGATVEYVVIWSESPTFTPADSAFAGRDTTFTFGPSALDQTRTYYWKVRASSTSGRSRWSDPGGGRSFHTGVLTPVVLAASVHSTQEGILLTWDLLADPQMVAVAVLRRDPQHPEWLPLFVDPPGGEAVGQYLDRNVEPWVSYEYLVEVRDDLGIVTQVGPIAAQRTSVELDLAVYPSPGRGAVNVALNLPSPGDAVLRLFDASGREVAHRDFRGLRAGTHTVVWTPDDDRTDHVPSGSYWLCLYTESGRRCVPWSLVR